MEKQPQGSYRLNLEDPRKLKRLEERDRRLIAWFRETYGQKYDELFAGYGIAPDIREHLIDHITKIYQAKIETRKVTTQMMDAQWEYRDRMKVLLGAKYADYLKHEELWPVREEMGFIEQFGQKAGTPLSSDRLSELHDLLATSQAFSIKTIGSLGGPIGSIPQPIYGSENTVPHSEQNQAKLALQSEAMIEQARAAGFTLKEIELLQDYYRGQLAYYDDAIDLALPATPRKIARAEQELAELRQNPVANATKIKRAEDYLAWMQQKLHEQPKG